MLSRTSLQSRDPTVGDFFHRHKLKLKTRRSSEKVSKNDFSVVIASVTDPAVERLDGWIQHHIDATLKWHNGLTAAPKLAALIKSKYSMLSAMTVDSGAQTILLKIVSAWAPAMAVDPWFDLTQVDSLYGLLINISEQDNGKADHHISAAEMGHLLSALQAKQAGWDFWKHPLLPEGLGPWPKQP